MRRLLIFVCAVSAFAALPATASATHAVDLDCPDFQDQSHAQEHLLAHPGDPDDLDPDRDGRACELLPCPCGAIGALAPTPTPPASSGPGTSPGTAGKFTAKMSLARATINRAERVLDVLAPITARASGRVGVELYAAGRRVRFTAPIDSVNGRIRFRQAISAAQARRGTGIVTITYAGDADTRPQTVRLRAASRPAVLRLERPRIVNGRVQASGSVSALARGVVRLQLEYVRGGQTAVLLFGARIRGDGRWSLNEKLSETALQGIAQRQGTLHYTLFTGYDQRRMRGEMRSFQVLGEL